jgi:hypothetical protein
VGGTRASVISTPLSFRPKGEISIRSGFAEAMFEISPSGRDDNALRRGAYEKIFTIQSRGHFLVFKI